MRRLTLVMDIGGSATRIGLAAQGKLVWKERVSTPLDITLIIQHALRRAEGIGRVTRGVLGIAAPVRRKREVCLTNAELCIHKDQVRERFPLIHWDFLNDVEGEAYYHAHILHQMDVSVFTAYPDQHVEDAHLTLLTPHTIPRARDRWVLVKPGTGLGVSIVENHVLSTELGHLPNEKGEWEEKVSIRGIDTLAREAGIQREAFFTSMLPSARGARHEWLSMLASYLSLLDTLFQPDGFILAGRILRDLPVEDVFWLGKRFALQGKAWVLLVKAEFAGLKGLARYAEEHQRKGETEEE